MRQNIEKIAKKCKKWANISTNLSSHGTESAGAPKILPDPSKMRPRSLPRRVFWGLCGYLISDQKMDGFLAPCLLIFHLWIIWKCWQNLVKIEVLLIFFKNCFFFEHDPKNAFQKTIKNRTNIDQKSSPNRPKIEKSRPKTPLPT